MKKILFIGFFILATLGLNATQPQFRLFDSIQIESNFDGEPPKYSYGVLLEGGYVLGTDSSLFKNNHWARNNRIKILDTIGLPMIYFAIIEPYAVDREQKIALYKITAFTDPYGNQTDMNKFHFETIQTRGASFIPKEGTAKRKRGYKNEPLNQNIPLESIPKITKSKKNGVYYLANEAIHTKTILFYPYTKQSAVRITKSQIEVYLKEYDQVPPELMFYAEQKNPSPLKIIDVTSELKAIAKQAQKETPLPGFYAMVNIANLYPQNPIGSPVWNPAGDLEGIIIASRPKDNLMLDSTRIFSFFCAVAARDGYENALRKRILRHCPASFKR